MLLHRHRLRVPRIRPGRAEPVPLRELDPELAHELRAVLLASRDPELANAVGDLAVAEPCRCDDPECASFYTVDRFRAAWYWGRRGRTIPLRPGLSIDAAGTRIIAVEVHDRPSLRRALEEVGENPDSGERE